MYSKHQRDRFPEMSLVRVVTVLVVLLLLGALLLLLAPEESAEEILSGPQDSVVTAGSSGVALDSSPAFFALHSASLEKEDPSL